MSVFSGVRRHWFRNAHGRQSCFAPWSFTALKPLNWQFEPLPQSDLPAEQIQVLASVSKVKSSGPNSLAFVGGCRLS